MTQDVAIHDLASGEGETNPRNADLAMSAATEWSNLVTAAVLGTDRKPLPIPPRGWEAMRSGDDAAVELLNRAAAVVTARRAGIQPARSVLPIEPAPGDDRPVCSAVAADQLARMLAGAHDILLPEWLSLCAAAGYRPPPHLTPTLLLRGRRSPAFDQVARALVGARAAWLADAMPELGVRVTPKPAPPGADAFLPPAPPPDSGAVVSAIVATFLDRSATWAAAGQLRLAVAAIQPEWLPALILELNRAPFHSVTERTRVDLLGVAQMRREMTESLKRLDSISPVALPDDRGVGQQ